MERSEIERVKGILYAMRDEMSQPSPKRDEIVVENAPDSLDRVQNAADRDLAIRQIEIDFNRLQSVNLALSRIEDGTYGICLSCEEEISIKRLRAVPWASYCVRCQDIADRERSAPGEEEFASSAHGSHVRDTLEI
jgi:DnaK suppressor protein